MRRLWSFRDMKASTRFLVISGAAIGILVVVAVVLVLTVGDGESSALLPEDTPEGVVQRFLLAIEAEDYEEAYNYLHSTRYEREPYQSWFPWYLYQGGGGWQQVTLGESTVVGYGATVEVTFTYFYPSVPLVDPSRTHKMTFYLQKEVVSWGIVSP